MFGRVKKAKPVTSDENGESVRQVHVTLSATITRKNYSAFKGVIGLTEPYRILPGEDPSAARRAAVEAIYSDLEELLGESVAKLDKAFRNALRGKGEGGS